METINIRTLIGQHLDDPLGLLKALDGLYECPKDAHGKRTGPLVGYAANYTDAEHKERQYVGDIYANFAKAEEYPIVLSHWGRKLWEQLCINKHIVIDDRTENPEYRYVFVGPQMGGVSIAQFVAYNGREVEARYACAEKKITQLKSATMREQSEIVFARHSIKKGDKVFIVEDVMNNFSTTKKVIDLVETHDATVVGIAGILNRSPFVETIYEYGKRSIPVTALVRKAYPEYKQDEIAVLTDMQKGNVILKPKDEWRKLVPKK
jgi:adenine/guanine phosphoribosyltransferase-like PRPP-binding protein